MKTQMTHPWKRLAALALCLLLAAVCLLPAAARTEGAGKTVRVGWYESAFHRTDQFGRRSGYGYEYQQRVAVYTGWTYEYVEGSWSELYEMLVAGDLDLLSDVSYTPERAEKILYSAEAMGSEDYHVFIAPDNTEIRPDDFTTFNGKKVGVNKNSIQEQLFIAWAENHNVHPEIVELSVKTPELLEMLARGEIDMLVTLDTYGNQADVVPVCKVGYAESFFGINRNRPDLKKDLDMAMNRLIEDNRDFNQQMTDKFNRAGAVNSFLTPEEKDWVNGHGTIRVGYRDGFLPFCSLDENGNLDGTLDDFLTFAATCEKNAVLSFESKPYTTTEEALAALSAGEVDCVFPVTLSAYDGEQRGVIVTDPFVNTEMYAVVRTADHQGVSPEREMTVATVKGHLNHETFLKDNFPNWSIRYYDNSAAGLQAVSSGDADCALVSNYRINRVSRECAKLNLSPLSTGAAMDMSFALKRDDDCLYSILNKIIRLVPGVTLNASLTNHAFAEEKVTFGDFLKDNLPLVAGVAAAVFAVVVLLLSLGLRAEKKAQARRQIITETERDHLTPLYNRSFFMLYVNRFFQEHPDIPRDAIVLNIERFHTLNALNGRDYGDEVLRALGQEIAAFLTEKEGIGGRVESDHFDLYCAHPDDYQALLDRFQASVDAVARNADIKLRMGVMPWQQGMNAEHLFDLAWSCCSMIRGDYKTHLMVYDEQSRRREELTRWLQNDLGRALENREIEIYYQPKYEIQGETPQLSSAEALVRWRHPELGMVPPTDFIPLFEQSGQIGALDHYVWAEAARQTASWRDALGKTVPISVNISRVDVFDPELPDILDGLLAKNGLKPGDLHLEITESAYTENADHLVEVIGALREKGYQIEMDDFGSGYSSLNMLSSMPIDVLKMDREFVRCIDQDEKDIRLVELILNLAKNLKIPVIAEGVETEQQLRLLKNLGCELVQGYYFSRPLPAREFEETILRNGSCTE